MVADATRPTATLSQRARELLSKEEGNDVDFKRNRSGLKAEDMVAFANSPEGGVILIGVDEVEDANGRQRGKVVGCKISDGEKLAIISKATSCRPPIDIEIYVETTDEGVSFYRIEIPSGQYKPYCTDKGLYMIRGDGRNIPLTPDRLLDLYLEVQGRQFFHRFRQATTVLEKQLEQSRLELKVLNQGLYQIKEKISKELDDILLILESTVEDTSEQIQYKLNDIFNSADQAEKLSDDALSFSMEAFEEIQAVSRKLEKMKVEVSEMSEKVNAVLSHFHIEHPQQKHDPEKVKKLPTHLYPIYADQEKVLKKRKKSQ
ncbi:AlbA family DNA-binding domain-containing protein [Thermoflavimicrobium dichotomicum]|uniref:Putative DNA-binding domain-containing protein n=1 Tax=Thermoflavimicrobium dichotomicum TaxID=46223 RepID=A0A1I3LMK4_9BACL|nr:ATP-binding protein [Thermoflavimicrobium dichotomicum]SFI85988.1 Putative DNA-binding domain-containing protein [Thermoflavimicrobium dichotomicum]